MKLMFFLMIIYYDIYLQKNFQIFFTFFFFYLLLILLFSVQLALFGLDH